MPGRKVLRKNSPGLALADELNNNPSEDTQLSQAGDGSTPPRRAQLTSRKRLNKRKTSVSKFERDHDTLSLDRFLFFGTKNPSTKNKKKEKKISRFPDPEDQEISFVVTEGEDKVEDLSAFNASQDLECDLSWGSLTELAHHFEQELGGNSFVGDGQENGQEEEGGSVSNFYDSLAVEGYQNLVDTAFGLLEVTQA